MLIIVVYCIFFFNPSALTPISVSWLVGFSRKRFTDHSESIASLSFCSLVPVEESAFVIRIMREESVL